MTKKLLRLLKWPLIAVVLIAVVLVSSKNTPEPVEPTATVDVDATELADVKEVLATQGVMLTQMAEPIEKPTELVVPTAKPTKEPEVITCSNMEYMAQLVNGFVGDNKLSGISFSECIFVEFAFENDYYIRGRVHKDGKFLAACNLVHEIEGGFNDIVPCTLALVRDPKTAEVLNAVGEADGELICLAEIPGAFVKECE